jgi:uncharacterized protein (TIGR03437 family)
MASNWQEVPRVFFWPGLPLLITMALLPGLTENAAAAQPNRVTRQINGGQIQVVKGNLHPLARPQFDRGPLDPSSALDHVLLLYKLSAPQQTELDQLLAAQQNPSSPRFHKWLTPEGFADQFGVSPSDNATVVRWLQSQGLTVNESGRGRNWVAFSGTAGKISSALKTSIRRYQVNGETHFANATEPAVPEALAEIAGGFLGLDDFHPKPSIKKFTPITDPDYNRGTAHYLAPEDFATIYNLTPLYQAGFDGAGQSIAVVGQSAVSIADIRAFRTRYNLPANDPQLIRYGADPGFTGAELEGDLDLEWSGAIAPKATIYYIYGANALTATVAAVNQNYAPVISISYGNCEIEFSVPFYRTVAQQANAQGITILAASGDSGAAACDSQNLGAFATRGRAVGFPAVLPEVTALGGTQFNEGTGTYWAGTNSAAFGSALSYIPEIAWNENSVAGGLGSGGGGSSILIAKPDWQSGPGVPNDQARDVPDISLSAGIHDSYVVNFEGLLGAVGGTSAPTPALAGIIAILNQYQVSRGFQQQPGLGNLNPQLYRLAQAAPSAFHDITSGDNFVPCAQGTPDCLTGTYGYPAGPGYDLVTGLGSIDANILVGQWNTATHPAAVTLTASPSSVTLNDNVRLTAVVIAANGTGSPTGFVNFSAGLVALGSAALQSAGGQQQASVTVSASVFGAAGIVPVAAVYSGDAAFSGGTGQLRLQVTRPAGVSVIVPSASPNPIYAAPADAQGLSWQTILTLREISGVGSTLTAFLIDGELQPLSLYFPSTSIPANGALTANIVFRNLAYPLTRTFKFVGVDATGNTWARQVNASFLGPQVFQNFTFSAAPLTLLRNANVNPNTAGPCEWPQVFTLDETGGFAFRVTALVAGNVDISSRISSIFGTTRLAPWGSLQGKFCWDRITPPASNNVFIELTDEFGQNLAAELTVSFAPPASGPPTLSASPASLSLQQTLEAALAVDPGDQAQPWTASIYPANRTTSWLRLSQYSGTGPVEIILNAAGAGLGPGAYRALIVVQSANTLPQTLTVPVMFVLGASAGSAITGAGSALSFKNAESPGMILSVYGSQLANSVEQASSLPLPYTLDGVTATINGVAAPLYYISPDQLNIQIPYEAGAGPAVLGINNHGQIAGYQFQIAPSAPAILADANGNVVPGIAGQGSTAVLYMSGEGDVSPAIRTGFTPSAATPLSILPKPLLPLSVTVGGIQAFLQFVGITPGVAGLTQVNFIVPASVPAGVQPVIVTVGGVSSPPANLTVQGAASGP